MPRPSPQTDRVVTVIGLLAASPDRNVTLAEVARRLDTNRTTCLAMLRSLVEANWLVRDPLRKTYRLGPALIGIGHQAAASYPALELARSAIATLSLELRLHCAVLEIGDGVVTVLEQVRDPSARGIGLHPGTSYPIRPPFVAGVVAHADAATREAWLSLALPNRRDGHLQALDAIRERGFTVELAPPQPAAYRRLLEELHELPAPPPDGRRVDDVLAELAALADAENYLVADIEPDATYRLNDLCATVFDHDGPAFLLALSGFTAPLSGDEVMRIGRRLVAVTNELSAALRHP